MHGIGPHSIRNHTSMDVVNGCVCSSSLANAQWSTCMITCNCCQPNHVLLHWNSTGIHSFKHEGLGPPPTHLSILSKRPVVTCCCTGQWCSDSITVMVMDVCTRYRTLCIVRISSASKCCTSASALLRFACRIAICRRVSTPRDDVTAPCWRPWPGSPADTR